MTNKSKFRFTQRAIDALPPHRADSPSKSAEYSDTEVVGLRLSVNKLGRKFFYFRFTFNGQKRAMKIGEYPALSIVDARKKALEMRSDIDSGIDPTAERDRIRGTPTFRDFALNDYMEWARGSKRSWKTDDSKLRNHIWCRALVIAACATSPCATFSCTTRRSSSPIVLARPTGI